MISYNETNKSFEIQTPSSTLILKVDNEGCLRVVHYGKKILHSQDVWLELPTLDTYINSSEKRPARCEFPFREKAYYCEPCIAVELSDGSRDICLKYVDYKISETANGEKLEITLQDNLVALEVTLIYETFRGLDLICKNSIVKNKSVNSIKITKIKSGTLVPEWNVSYKLTTYVGGWGKEYQKQQNDICQGKFVLENTRGTASSHQNVPFFFLDSGDASETSGNVWYGILHYSGDFRIDFEKDFTNQLTVSAGINDFDTVITLKPNETFSSPVFTVGFSDKGYEKMSENFYDYQYDYFLPQSKIKKIFPIIYNTWYPYEFDVDEEKCLSFIDKTNEIGAELFVIDDGWFGRRESDVADGLGDWYCHKQKFPHGLKPISDKAHSLGMKFGLWIEPEMVNVKSDLYKKHPEWVLCNHNKPKTMIRNQCVLNLARNDVKEFIWEVCDRIISEYSLDYLKWDMNAYFTELGENGGDLRIRYIENLYDIWKRINEKYPNLLLENCASGGGRADYGLARFSDRINRSDNSDPIDVLKIHEGFSTFFLPRLAGGAGNVATNPHHMNNRNVPLKYRALLGMTGSMSIGINILKSEDEEIQQLKKYISDFKKIRHITQNAYFYRISSAFENSYVVWEYLSRDRKDAVVFVFAHGMNFNSLVPPQKIRGLDSEKKYRVCGENSNDPSFERIVHGDALMNFGIRISPCGDYDCQLIRISEI